MKFWQTLAAGLLLLGLAATPAAHAANPVDPPGTYYADPEPFQGADGLMYLYCSHDVTPGVWCGDDYHVLSSSDLIHWQDNGVSYRTPGTTLYACQCVSRDGKYYLYYATPDGKDFVATGLRPTGPFSNAVQIAGITGIDPGVFIDDDGRAYLYWGQLNNVRAARLKPDMTEVDQSTVIQPLSVAGDNFHEGSAVAKRNGVYYFVYADTGRHGGKPTSLGYATGPTPLGPFTYRGVIIDSYGCDPGVWNDHGRIAEFHGHWYVFYHRSTHDGGYQRQTCVEPITFNPDGTIPEVEMTAQGAGGPLPATATLDAARACDLSGTVRVEDCALGGLELGATTSGDYAAYKYLDFGKGVTQFAAQVTEENTGGVLELRLDGPLGRLIGRCVIPRSPTLADNARRAWVRQTCAVSGAGGVHALYLRFAGDPGAKSVSIKAFQFQR